MSESQHSRIIKVLRKNHRHGTPNYVFSTRMQILDYTARISELRHEGYNIIAQRQQLPNGRYTNVFNYFLIEDKEKPKYDRSHKVDGMHYEKEIK